MFCYRIVLFVWKSWCLLFILLLTSVYVFICVHLSALLWASSSSARLFYVKLSWKLQNVSRNLGVLRTFVALVLHCFMCSFLLLFLLGFFFFLVSKSTSWVKYIECGSTQALLFFYIVQLEAHFIFQCVLPLVHSTVLLYLFKAKEKKPSLLINAFFSVWHIKNFDEFTWAKKTGHFDSHVFVTFYKKFYSKETFLLKIIVEI